MAVGTIAIIAYVAGFWIWRSYGFPIEHEICKYAADGTKHDCAPYNVGLIALWKIGEAFSDLAFVTALATVVIGAFTGTLWWSTRGMQRATNESITLTRDELKLARDEFFSTHRPRILLRHIWLATADGKQSFAGLQNQTPIIVRLDIRNTGDLIGYVRVINYVTRIIQDGSRLPQRPIYNEPDGGHIRAELADVEVMIGRTLTVPLSDGRILSTQEIENIRSGTHRLYFVGTIEYWWGSDRDRLRQTAYCRYLSGTNGRFEVAST